MWGIIFWTYFITGVMLIHHEIDGAYWHEWKLFKLPGGIEGFMVFNLIAIPPFMYGFAEVARQTFAGLIFSLALACVGIFTFAIHMFFFKIGKPEFKTPMSVFILASILASSIIQLFVTIRLLAA